MDEIKPTPRNKLLGLLADNLRSGLDFATNEGKNKPMNLLAEVLGLPAIQTTADRLSYGEPLTTGAGWATRLKPDTFDAGISVLPFAKPLTKGAGLLAEGLRGLEGSKAVQSLSKASPMADRGAIVWHGSPHKFDAFDASKIGTGEGAQAYGHGLYLAESPDVANGYRNALTGNHNLDQFNPTVNGEIVNSPVVKNLIRNGHTPEQFISSMQKKLDSQLFDLSKASKADELGIGISDYDIAMMRVNDTKKMIDEASGYIGKNIKNEPLGNIYKVDLPDEYIAKMLDWDKPLSQQAPHVRDILEKLPQSSNLFTTRPAPKNGLTEILSPSGDGMGYYQPHEVNEALKDLSGGFFKKIAGKELTAEDIYSRLANASTKTGVENKFGISLNGQPAASELLRQQGITGIKYLDGGSRAAGAGSSNYVVFPGNERLLKILERNGQKP